MSRIYLPTTLDGLREVVEAGVVEGIEPVVAESDLEDDEYAAMLAAADASQALLNGPGRRVVVVAEGSSAESIPLSEVAAVHADTEPVDPGDQDPPDLAWFAVQEISALLD